MATKTLALPSSRENSQPEHDGSTIDDLAQLVEKVEKKKAPQPAPSSPDDERRERNAQMLNALWEQGEKMFRQAALTNEDSNLDPLAIALNGFPDVNSYYAHYDNVRIQERE